MWLLCAWNERNNRLFKQKENTMIQLLEKLKSYSLWWLKAKKANFVLGHQLINFCIQALTF